MHIVQLLTQARATETDPHHLVGRPASGFSRGLALGRTDRERPPGWHRRLVLAAATHDPIALVDRQCDRDSPEREQARQTVASRVPEAEVDAVLACAGLPEKAGVLG